LQAIFGERSLVGHSDRLKIVLILLMDANRWKTLGWLLNLSGRCRIRVPQMGVGSVASDPIHVSETICFGDDFALDLRSHELRRAGARLKLERIPMELLCLLVEQGGEIVTRERIAERIWGKGVFLDTDNSINGAIRKIRQVLKDDPEQPLFIQTLTGKGYRFIAPTVEADLGREAATLPLQAAVSEGRARPASRWRVLLGAAVCLIVATGGFLWFRSQFRPQPPGGRLMLAVLPFENLTGDAGQDYFSDGLTEEMIARLGNVDPKHLGVIARTSVMYYKGGREPLDRIGRELGVQYVLEGSVRRDADKVRITAQLIQMRDQSHLWARQYDRELNNLLTLQGEIAQEVADEIQLTLGEHKRISVAREPILSPNAFEAYDLYLKGRYFWNKRTEQALQQAIDCFNQAIAKDPNSARAYSGLADSYALLSGYSLTPQTEAMPKARAAALKALELDEGLAEAHTSLALVTENYDWDWQTAEKEYRRAIELNPNYATAHQWYAEYLSLRGRFDEALVESEHARQLDPLSLIIATDNGAILYFSRQYDRAIAQFRAVLEMEPNFPRAHLLVGAYVEKGQFEDALTDIGTWGNTVSEPWTWAWRAHVYGRAGQQVEARHALTKLKELYRRQRIGPDPLLWAYVGMGDKDDAFFWFEKAFAAHSNVITALKVNPGFDPLRGDRRFQELLRRAGLDR